MAEAAGLGNKRNIDLAVLLVLAFLYRLYLSSIYFGWEESDYGNMAMAKGVLDSHFTHYDMRHLPLYYGLSAAALAITGDAVVATHGVSMLAGLMAIALGYLLAEMIFDRSVALLASALLLVQPEFALYSSTALREPLYCALMLLGLYLMLRKSAVGSAFSIGGAFLTRFDALFTGFPVLLFHHLTRPGPWPTRLKKAALSLGIGCAIIASWSIYCGLMHGDFLFIRSTFQVNVATGGAQEVKSTGEFLEQGFATSWAFLTSIMPRKLGWPMWCMAFIALGLLTKRALRQHTVRTFVLSAIINTGFLLAVAFVAQHEPNHNLYWKWMFVLVPFWSILASYTLFYAIRRLPKGASALLVGLSLVFTAQAFVSETQKQLEDSRLLYGPQVALAQWIEQTVPANTPMILDNIPACYLDRKDHNYELHSWFDINLPHGDRAAMASYIKAFNLKYILWFREDWTVAPQMAPYLADAREHQLSQQVSLHPLRSDDAYGFVFYEVRREE